MEERKTAVIRSLASAREPGADFETLFRTHYKGMVGYAYTILKEEEAAEEMVQHVFCKLWEKRDELEIHTSAKAYLYKMVYYESLNLIKHKKVMAQYASYAQKQPPPQGDDPGSNLATAELAKKIREAMNDLPEQCRTIFQLSRFEKMKYQEIADHLGLSVKTIENQMGKALRIMREKLSAYLPSILLLLAITITALFTHTLRLF